jgi:FAD/FMN-containing dehydrogenase
MPESVTARPPIAPLVAPGRVDHHVADMTATASAEMTLAELQRRLGEQDQWLPIDGDPKWPLGRLVEENSTGPLRLGYGAWRDLLLGVQFENGLGELITSGGRTVKNVAGYDLTKFMVGQGQVFGRVVTVTMRTYRRPAAALLARFAADASLVSRLMAADLRPQWAIRTRDALLLGYMADAATMAHYAAGVPRLRPVSLEQRTLEQDTAHRAELWRSRGEIRFRASLPPAHIERFVQAAGAADWVADAAFGVVLGSCGGEGCERVSAAASDAGGSVHFRREDGTLLSASVGENERKLLERLKEAFDPNRRLAPLTWGKR